MRKTAFWTVKDGLLQCERWPFAEQKLTFRAYNFSGRDFYCTFATLNLAFGGAAFAACHTFISYLR